METPKQKPQIKKPNPQKLSKLGRAMRKGVLKDVIIENEPDIWGLHSL
jgi:hypothetical protein